MTKRSKNSERGAALLEAALTLPLMLLVAVAIFEFGRAFQTWQVLTNAAREGARVAVLPSSSTSNVEARVRQYMQDGQLGKYASAIVNVDPNTTISIGSATASASQVTVTYPFDFIVLNPVARLVTPQTTLGSPITMTAAAAMRNESAF